MIRVFLNQSACMQLTFYIINVPGRIMSQSMILSGKGLYISKIKQTNLHCLFIYLLNYIFCVLKICLQIKSKYKFSSKTKIDLSQRHES